MALATVFFCYMALGTRAMRVRITKALGSLLNSGRAAVARLALSKFIGKASINYVHTVSTLGMLSVGRYAVMTKNRSCTFGAAASSG